MNLDRLFSRFIDTALAVSIWTGVICFAVTVVVQTVKWIALKEVLWTPMMGVFIRRIFLS